MSGILLSRRASLALAVASMGVGCMGPFDFTGLRLEATDTAAIDAAPEDAREAALADGWVAPLIGTGDSSDGDDGAPACQHREPPMPPPVSGRGGTLDLVFALNVADFGNSYDDAGQPNYRHIGFDMDHTCTGEGEGPSCAAPTWAASAAPMDGNAGIDNAAAQTFFSPTTNPPTTSANSYTGTLIVRVRDYSGDADDDQVSVALYVGVAVAPREDGGDQPVWDGQDRWSLHPDMVVPLGDGGTQGDGGTPQYESRFVDVHAYVTGNVLVAHWPYALWMSGLVLAPRALNPVHDVVLSARLVRVGQGWKLDDGVDAVKLVPNEFLPFLARTPTSPTSMLPVCSDPTRYAMVKQFFCSVVDIAVSPSGPTSPCNAISGGAAFTALPVLLGDLAPEPPSLPPCDVTVHPEMDSCAPPSPP